MDYQQKVLNQMFYDFVRKNDVHGVRRILFAGADPNSNNCLQYAIRNGKNRMAYTILKRGGNPNITTKNGETALVQYLRRLWLLKKCNGRRIHLNYSLVELLLEKTNLNIVDKFGNSALNYATRLSGILPPRISSKISEICENLIERTTRVENKKSTFNNYSTQIFGGLLAITAPVVATASGII